MDDFLDNLWGTMETGLESLALGMDHLISPLESLGPAWVIFILAMGVVGLTRVFVMLYRPRRHQELKQDFLHWHEVREAAVRTRDKEKGKAMAKNIDQAKLNRAYYDFFFEGMMKHMVTTVLPILLMLAYLSRTYPAENLLSRFGDKWIFVVGNDSPIYVGTLFWFIICLFSGFLLFGLAAYFLKKGKSR